MKYLFDPLLELDEYKNILDSIKNYTMPVNVTGPSDSQKVHLACSICAHADKKGVYVAYNEMQAQRAFEDFSFFLGPDAVYLPSKEIMLYDVEAKSYDEVYTRIKALDRILRGDFKFLVTSPEALVHKLISPEFFKDNTLSFVSGGRADIGMLSEKLVSMGYERTNVVEGKGQFAVRGGILDVFSPDSDVAYRIELFDDEIDSIRNFDIYTQRSMDKLDEIRILPARDIIYTREQRKDIIENIRDDLKNHLKGLKNKAEHAKLLEEKVLSDIEAMQNDHYFPGIDRYIPYILSKPSFITDYIDDSAVIFLDEPGRIKQRIDNIALEYNETCTGLMEKSKILPSGFNVLFDYETIREKCESHKNIGLYALSPDAERQRNALNYSIASKAGSSYGSNFKLLIEDIANWKKNRKRVLVLSGIGIKGERFSQSLAEEGIVSFYHDEIKQEISKGQVIITGGSLNTGFEYVSIGFVVVSDKGLFGQNKRAKKSYSRKKGDRIKAFTDLKIGDYVVHSTHGIGQYVGIQTLEVDNARRDYLKILYKDGDYLYIPTSQLDVIQKFIGTDGKQPKLSKLGGTEWAKTKKKVKESLKELAEDLVQLYAKRQAMKGHAFSKDTIWQKQFEETFPYEETEDQLRCIEEIKRDMESEKPMDRLLCGDVGYGKTEVAIRAIFKAVMDGKQVAYLVPTTILAQQHYENFVKRMKDFPVKVDVISRFRSQSEQQDILRNLKAGRVDVLIGTHRLIQKDIEFKDLGLIVIDEEQRFGVGHKERLKNLMPNVDVLTLTATPIPRTLHMSLVGIRDISTIEEPPEERHPVQTYVMEYNVDVLKDAIARELARHGQVFYLYNRVRSIHVKASEIQAMFPDARVAVAHGQMDEKELEDVMHSFINREYDILVCTTIIESGLDMPNVNTIIVEDADKMGLAQLYQLRGRVGRSERLGYAYITYKKDKVLSEVAEKRLQAIKEFTEFGSGFKIAMRDLEIRGAGNLLGPQQHGHMDAVGYDMYCKLLDEAVRELKGDQPISEEQLEVTVDINVNAYIDNRYIDDETQKIEMYKKIASIQDEQDVLDIQDELIDRYGNIPDYVDNLIKIASIKALARECGFSSVREKGQNIILQYGKSNGVDLELLGKIMDAYPKRILFTANKEPYITFKPVGQTKEEVLDNIKILLQDIKKLKLVK